MTTAVLFGVRLFFYQAKYLIKDVVQIKNPSTPFCFCLAGQLPKTSLTRIALCRQI